MYGVAYVRVVLSNRPHGRPKRVSSDEVGSRTTRVLQRRLRGRIVESQARGSSWNMATLALPSSLITPLYIPSQFKGIASAETVFGESRNEERKDSQFPLSSSTMTPPRPPSLRKSSTHTSDAALIDSPLNFTRRAIVEHVAKRMKYYATNSVVNAERWK